MTHVARKQDKERTLQRRKARDFKFATARTSFYRGLEVS